MAKEKVKIEIGQEFLITNYGMIRILGLSDSHKRKGADKYYKVRFIDTGYETEASKSNILRGRGVKDKYIPSVHGIGYLGKANPIEDKQLYDIWKNMISRCYNKYATGYGLYGGSGITVDRRWHSFENFLVDAVGLEGYNELFLRKRQIQLDKDKKQQNIDKSKMVYSKETCMWITRKENSLLAIESRISKERNKIYFKAVSPDGREVISSCQAKLAREYSLNTSCIGMCLKGKHKQHKGWRFEYVRD